ncbi:hypothetical protein [Humibacter ginsenosidimutans]|uniref:Uncharacterized protein n=1 Tax=Humibacter ginsenosidimutans TaxID=2599293 RepID=A0A5B8M3N3_9MICO|nr:hypothetical protein [Humibacter ginsenosidimutans]QDZ14761.1 hypothetical protein FPZ11_08320 [Humibacter ginsenosidimutans]
MASKGYTIAAAMDTRLFEQGVRMGIIKPVEDADDALEGLGKNKGADQLERELKDAQRATDKLGDDTRQATEQMQRDYQKAARAAKQADDDTGRSFELSTREKTKLSKETIHEIGDEAKQNAAETFSSFDGSAQSFVDGIQGTLGGLVASLGPVGLAAGAAGALGIGLINGALGKADEDTQQFRQDVADLATDLIETGSKGQHSIGYIVDQLKKMATETDPTAVSLKKIHDQAKQLSVPFKDLALAYAAGGDQLDEQITMLKKLSRQAAEASTDYGNFGSALSNANNKAVSGYQDQIAALEAVRKKNKAAAQEEQEYADTGAAAMERKQKLIEGVNDAYDDAASSVDDYVDSETGVFDTSKYIAAMQAKQKALQEYQENLKTLGGGLGADATNYIESLGADQASILLDAYKNASAAQQANLRTIWGEAGKDNSGAYVDAAKKAMPKTIDGPKVKVGADDSDAQRTYDKWNSKAPIRVGVEFVTSAGRRVF